MSRVVFFTISMLIALLIDATAIGLAATSGSLLLTLLACIPAPLLVWVMVAARFDNRHRHRRAPLHRGATKDDYDPWIGGGIG